MVDEGGCTTENGSEGGDIDVGMVAEGGCIGENVWGGGDRSGDSVTVGKGGFIGVVRLGGDGRLRLGDLTDFLV